MILESAARMAEKNTKNQRRTPKQARSRAKYEAILSAATRVLLAEGYQRSTTEKIALEADVSIGTLYEYFTSKDDIYNVYINRQLSDLMDQVVVDAQTWLGHESIQALSRRLTARSVDFFYAHREIVKTIVQEVPGVWHAINLHHLNQRIADVIALVAGVSVQSLEDPAWMRLGKILRLSVTGLILSMVALEENALDPEALKLEIDCLVRGYLKERLQLDLTRL